jgi:ubiquinone biosynthesis protein
MFKTIRHFFRLIFIIKTLARNVALFPLQNFKIARIIGWFYQKSSPDNIADGARLAASLEQLGPIFIKLGQSLSTRADLVGPDIASSLAHLRDRLPAFDVKLAKEIIELELGSKLEDLFSQFDEIPIAAASIAQVHKAITKDGKVVAVKVRRPGIEQAFARDIELFYFMDRFLEKNNHQYRRLKLTRVVETFARSVKMEMDFRFEAAAASELKENFAGDETIYIPEIFWQLTSSKVLVIEWVDAIPINENAKLLQSGIDLSKIAANLSVMYFNQAYRDGFFHADLHAGNIFINDKSQIVLIDFGIMGRLNKKTRIYVAEILKGFLDRDYYLVAKIHFDAGYVPNHHDIYSFAQSCRSIGEPIVGVPANQISIAKLLAQLFKITEDYDMETQPQLLLLQKTMMMVEGIGTSLNPEVNMWQLAEPWIEEWAIDNIGPEAKLLELFRRLINVVKENLK